MSAAAFADGQGPQWRETASRLKGAVAAMNSADATGSALVGVDAVTAYDFVEALRPQTIIGRLTGFVRVPFNCRMLSVASGLTAHWRGQGSAISLGKLDLDSSTLTWAVVDAMAAFTAELARHSGPGVETALAQDIVKATALAIDQAFIDPESTAIAGVRPASITAGATTIHSTGGTVAQIDADLKAAVEAAGDADLSTAAWVMRPKSALALATMRGSGGALAYPTVTAKGGTLLGLPVLTSNAVGPDVNSPAESYLALVVAGEVALADDGQALIDYTDQAALKMDDAATDAASSMVSLWQHGLAAIKASRVINWQRRRSVAAVVIDGIQF